MIPGDLLSAFPHREFHTLPGLLDSRVALPNSYPNALRAMQGGILYQFYDGLWYDPAERRTHDLPCERRTRYRLSQPDTVMTLELKAFAITLVLEKAWDDYFRLPFMQQNETIISTPVSLGYASDITGFVCVRLVPPNHHVYLAKREHHC